MHRSGVAGAIALAAMALFAAFAGTAVASKLVIKTEPGGEVLKPGALVESQVSLEGCSLWGTYELATNSAGTDRVKNPTSTSVECFGSATVSGAIKEVKLSAKGVQKFKMSPKLALTVPGPCVYEFASFSGSFTVPFKEYPFSEITATGKVNKKLSAGGCTLTKSSLVYLFGVDIFEGEVL